MQNEILLLRGVVGNLVAILVDHKSLSAEDVQKILGANCEVVDNEGGVSYGMDFGTEGTYPVK